MAYLWHTLWHTLAYFGILWHTLSAAAIQRMVSFLVYEKAVNRFVADSSRGILWLTTLSALAIQWKVSFLVYEKGSQPLRRR